MCNIIFIKLTQTYSRMALDHINANALMVILENFANWLLYQIIYIQIHRHAHRIAVNMYVSQLLNNFCTIFYNYFLIIYYK